MKKWIIVAIMMMFLTVGVNVCFAAKALKKTVAVFDFDNDSGYRSKATLGKDFSTQFNAKQFEDNKNANDDTTTRFR